MAEARRYDHERAAAQRRQAAAGAGQPPRLSGRNTYSRFVGWMKVVLPALAVRAAANMMLAKSETDPQTQVAAFARPGSLTELALRHLEERGTLAGFSEALSKTLDRSLQTAVEARESD